MTVTRINAGALAPVAGPVMIEVVEEAGGFAALEGEWGGLYAASPKATPFQSWAWLYSWWEHYGDGLGLRLVLARDDGGRLVGTLPLMLERPLGRLRFIATGHASYLDMLAREGWEEAVAGAFAGALERMGGWRVADLEELRPGAAAWRLFELWERQRVSIWQGYSTVVEAKPWEELLASLKKKYRSDARRAIKLAGAEGARWEFVGAADAAERAAGTLVDLNREQWRERWRETSPDHWSERFREHLQAAAHRISADGLGGISEFRREGEPILSTFLLFGRDSVGVYMVGASREALRRYSYSSLFVRDMVDIARGRGVPHIEFFRGEDPYKLRWNPKTVDNHRIVLGKNRLYWTPYAGYLALRFKAVRYAQSEDSPEWARNAALAYVRLRYRLVRLAGPGTIAERVRGLAGRWPGRAQRREERS